MLQKSSPEKRILEALMDCGACDLEVLVAACHEFTWNQLFLAVDRLSRTGRIRLKSTGPGMYVIALACTQSAFQKVPR